MKMNLIVLTVLPLCVLLIGSVRPAEEKDAYVESAELFLNRLLAEKFEEAAVDFDATMSRVMPAEKLAQTWKQVLAQAGEFQEQTGFRRSQAGGYEIVFLTCAFQRAALDIRVVFDKARKIAGLFFHPAQPPYSLPDYADAGSYREEEITVGSGSWALPGTLTIPEGTGPFPALVLVHGSGPNDRDETLGPNKPFKDIGAGLASRGVAVLRYDKRTKVHGTRMTDPAGRLTVLEETIEDAALAAALLLEREEIRKDGVFVLGHSLGGMLIPRIDAAAPGAAGFIVMAGAVEPLEDAFVRQITYISGLDGLIDPGEESKLEEYREARDRIKALGPSDIDGGSKLLGAFPAYWLDLRGYDPPAAARSIRKPLLILQGGRDYQVTPDSLDRWRTALSEKDNAAFKLYPSLNHLFIAGTGAGNPTEYQRAGHVALEVIEDIAAWIKSSDLGR